MEIIAPIVKAVEAGDTKSAKHLAEKIEPNEVNQQGFTPLMEVSLSTLYVKVQSLIKVAQLLLDAGANIDIRDSWGFTALVFAARDAEDSHLDLVKFLIDRGADVNTKIKHGGSALSLAAECGNINSVKMLIDAGADVSTTDDNGNTVLIASAYQACSAELVNLLVSKGVNVNASNKDNETALMKAAQRGDNKEVIEALIEKKADVNRWDRFGVTALMRAAKGVDIENVKVLVEAGANVSAVDYHDSSVLEWAARFDYRYMSSDQWDRWQEQHLTTVKYLVEKGDDDSDNQKKKEKALAILEKIAKNCKAACYLREQLRRQ